MPKYYNKNKSINEVLNGEFPESDVMKMSGKHLEIFVLNLVKCSSNGEGKDVKSFTELYKTLCLKPIRKPKWWPSESIIEQSLTTDDKCFMDLLRFLIYKCCEFFKKPYDYEGLNNNMVFVNENYKNFKGVKRKCEADSTEVPIKCRALLPKNFENKSFTAVNNTLNSQSIQLKYAFCKSKSESLKQHMFLKNFGLRSTSTQSGIEKLQDPVIKTSIKFNSCSVIPFSSDLGRELLKKDNHIISESVKSRRLERLEWYVNQPPPCYIQMVYDVTYQGKKDLTFHNFKFPKRSIWQHPGDVEYQKKTLFCKLLKVVLVRDNLEAIRNNISYNSQPKLRVLLSRMQ